MLTALTAKGEPYPYNENGTAKAVPLPVVLRMVCP